MFGSTHDFAIVSSRKHQPVSQRSPAADTFKYAEKYRTVRAGEYKLRVLVLNNHHKLPIMLGTHCRLHKYMYIDSMYNALMYTATESCNHITRPIRNLNLYYRIKGALRVSLPPLRLAAEFTTWDVVRYAGARRMATLRTRSLCCSHRHHCRGPPFCHMSRRLRSAGAVWKLYMGWDGKSITCIHNHSCVHCVLFLHMDLWFLCYGMCLCEIVCTW